MQLNPIGFIESPYKVKGDAPRQGHFSNETMTLVLNTNYTDGLTGLKAGDEILVLYWGDRADRSVLLSTPPGRSAMTGVFASRSPNRPNPIALCTAQILKIENERLRVVGLDALDGSPLLDIKIAMKPRTDR